METMSECHHDFSEKYEFQEYNPFDNYLPFYAVKSLKIKKWFKIKVKVVDKLMLDYNFILSCSNFN